MTIFKPAPLFANPRHTARPPLRGFSSTSRSARSTKVTRSIGIALTVFGLISVACDEETANHQPAGHDPKLAPVVEATRVEAAVIEPSTAQMRLVRPGEVEGARDANLAAALGGYVERISVTVGDRVRKGQLVAKVDSSLYSAQSDLAEVELNDALREFTRLKGIGSSIPRVRVDAAETRLARARAQYRLSQIQRERTQITAPFAGVVTAAEVEKGEFAAPGMTIVRLIQLDPAVISVSVADRDVSSLKVGSKAHVTTAALGQTLEGTIAQIHPSANLKTRSFEVEVEVPNADDTLRPGMIASVDFRQTSTEKQIVIPQDFLVTRQTQTGVFIVDAKNRAQWRTLKLGKLVRDQVIVSEGLVSGDNIVVVGQRALEEGDPLLVLRQGRCCEEGRVTYTALAGAQPDKTSTKPETEEKKG